MTSPMTDAPRTCAFCNTLLTSDLLAASSNGKRCPRCGEMLPAELRREANVPPASEPATAAALVESRDWPGHPHHHADRGLDRADVRAQNPGLSPQERLQGRPGCSPRGAVTRRMGGAGLPSRGLRSRGRHPCGRIDPRVRRRKLLEPPRPAAIDVGLEQLRKWCGLRLDDVDHVVLAAQFPQVTVVVRTAHAIRERRTHAEPGRDAQRRSAWPAALRVPDAAGRGADLVRRSADARSRPAPRQFSQERS